MSQAIYGGTADTEDYYPLHSGDRWVYRVFESGSLGESTAVAQVQVMNGTRDVGGRTVHVVTTTGPGMSTEEYYSNDTGPVVLVGGAPDGSALRLLSFPLRAGDQRTLWSVRDLDAGEDYDGDTVNDRITSTAVQTVVGTEDVDTASARFNGAMKLQTLITETVALSRVRTNVTVTNTVIEWYVPHVGLVRTEVTQRGEGLEHRTTYDLVAYSVNGRTSGSTGPDVVSITPAAGSTISGSHTGISVVFTEDIDPLSLWPQDFQVTDEAGAPVYGSVMLAGKTATFLPDGPIATGTVTVRVGPDISDYLGRPMTVPYSSTFVVDAKPYGNLTAMPANRATNVPVGAPIRLDFSVPPSGLNTVSRMVRVESADQYDSRLVLLNDSGGATWDMTVTTSSSGLVITPTQPWRPNTTYFVTVDVSTTDSLGNGSYGRYRSSFTATGLLATPASQDLSGVLAAQGDLNSDGRSDVAVLTYADAVLMQGLQVSVRLRNVDGSLASPVNYPVLAGRICHADSMQIGPVSGTGRNDVVVGTTDCGIAILTQSVSHALEPGTEWMTTDSRLIRLLDLNQDGLLDLLGAGVVDGTITTWLQQPGGGFGAGVTRSIGSFRATDLAIGDLNGDGRPDIAIVTAPTAAGVGVLLQTGGGGLTAMQTYGVAAADPVATPSSVAIADMDGDGRNDVVVGLTNIAKVLVYPGTTAGALSAPTVLDLPHESDAIQAFDVDRDGRVDIVALHDRQYRLSVSRQLPGMLLATPEIYVHSWGYWQGTQRLSAIDVNGDAWADLYADGSVYVNNSPGAVTASKSLKVSNTLRRSDTSRHAPRWLRGTPGAAVQ